MVHLNRVPTDLEVRVPEGAAHVETLEPEAYDGQDDFTATVYGSRYASQDLPRHEMPEKEMPPQVYVADRS